MKEKEWGYFVGGEIRTEGEPLEIRSCFDDTLVGRTFRPSEAVVEEAVQTALDSFAQTSSLPIYERAAALRAMIRGMEARRDEIVEVLALEAGKPVKAGRVEVDRCLFNLRMVSEETHRIEGELIPLGLLPAAKDRWGLIRRFPLGAVLAITPFNFPLNLVAHKIAPAFAAGNSVVQKPASKTPLSSLILADIAHQAGFPPGALNVLPCASSQAEDLVRDDRFKLLTFTGSAEIGWHLKSVAGKKRVSLELGGNAGVIIHSDCDLEEAAKRCAMGGFAFAGQSCIAVQRILVHRPAWEPFVKSLVDAVEALRVGNPLDEDTDVGPLISLSDAERVEEWVGEAVAGNAELLTGGRRDGAIYYPTVITNTRSTMKVNCCEVFGPVVTVEAYDSFDTALEEINNSDFGLQAGLFTSDNKRIFQAFEKLEVGGVVANDVPTFRADHMPYGGVKDSGTGREGPRYAIEEMTERKILVLNLE